MIVVLCHEEGQIDQPHRVSEARVGRCPFHHRLIHPIQLPDQLLTCTSKGSQYLREEASL